MFSFWAFKKDSGDNIYYVNLVFSGRMITPSKSCNWKGFIDVKTSQWKIGPSTEPGKTGRYYNME